MAKGPNSREPRSGSANSAESNEGGVNTKDPVLYANRSRDFNAIRDDNVEAAAPSKGGEVSPFFKGGLRGISSKSDATPKEILPNPPLKKEGTLRQGDGAAQFGTTPFHIARARISERAKGLWRELSITFNSSHGEFYIKQKDVAANLHCSTSTVRRATNQLIAAGFLIDLKKKHKGKFKYFKMEWGDTKNDRGCHPGEGQGPSSNGATPKMDPGLRQGDKSGEMPQDGANKSPPLEKGVGVSRGDVAQSPKHDKGEHVATTHEIHPEIPSNSPLKRGEPATIENQIARGYAIWYG
ncbi:hypothetical protein JYT19_01035, partial [Sulfobacillus acidophilus]|nr:hypothetical protein [Sulfobacillus acidophilus]